MALFGAGAGSAACLRNPSAPVVEWPPEARCRVRPTLPSIAPVPIRP